MGLSFEWLAQPAGFALAENLLPYESSDNYAWALFIGWLNSLRIIFFGLILATILGFSIGIARISKNILLRKISRKSRKFQENHEKFKKNMKFSRKT